MLENRVCLVTGSHAGIGFAIAKACLEAGAAVMIHARKAHDLDAGLSALRGAFGDRVDGALGDLSDPAAPAALTAETMARFGRLDGLVNNAAMLARSTLDDADADHIDAMFAVNVRAPLMLIRAAMPHLTARAAPGGAVVNVGSINAHCGAPNLLAYSASKGALQTATRNLGDALGGRPIRINQINVGWTLTENERKLQAAEGQPDNWLELLPPEFAPTGTILRPEEVATHAVFWLSDQSAPSTGQVYEVEQYPVIGRNRISTR